MFAFLLLFGALPGAFLADILGGSLDDLEAGVLLNSKGDEPEGEANRVLVDGVGPDDRRPQPDLASLGRGEYVEEDEVPGRPEGLVQELCWTVVRERPLPLHPGVVDPAARHVLPAAEALLEAAVLGSDRCTGWLHCQVLND